MVSGFDKRGTNYENVWEHGNIGQYWKGTREQGPPLGDPLLCSLSHWSERSKKGVPQHVRIRPSLDVPLNFGFASFYN